MDMKEIPSDLLTNMDQLVADVSKRTAWGAQEFVSDVMASFKSDPHASLAIAMRCLRAAAACAGAAVIIYEYGDDIPKDTRELGRRAGIRALQWVIKELEKSIVEDGL